MLNIFLLGIIDIHRRVQSCTWFKLVSHLMTMSANFTCVDFQCGSSPRGMELGIAGPLRSWFLDRVLTGTRYPGCEPPKWPVCSPSVGMWMTPFWMANTHNQVIEKWWWNTKEPMVEHYGKQLISSVKQRAVEKKWISHLNMHESGWPMDIYAQNSRVTWLQNCQLLLWRRKKTPKVCRSDHSHAVDVLSVRWKLKKRDLELKSVTFISKFWELEWIRHKYKKEVSWCHRRIFTSDQFLDGFVKSTNWLPPQ